ncbi:hypothetical protein QUB47_07770 [Microcoleus sp. AT9_B5]
MKKAISMLSNKEFTSEDNRLTYQLCEKLALICDFCGERIFLKQPSAFEKPGIKRSAHFSHYKDTGKNDCYRRSKKNICLQSSGSESKEQSLEKFQTKTQKLVNEGIINYQRTLGSQLNESKYEYEVLFFRRNTGKNLVDRYKIDINLWLKQFYKKRKNIQFIAASCGYNKIANPQPLLVSNIVHYLCLPTSENILENILYYVFFSLDKNVTLNKDFENVYFKVIELIYYGDWNKEYQEAQKILMDEIEGKITEELVSENINLESQTMESSIIPELWLKSICEEEKLETIKLRYAVYYRTDDENSEIRCTRIIGPLEVISITWHEDEKGDQHLTLQHNTTVVATFSLMVYGAIKWNPSPVYSVPNIIIARLLGLGGDIIKADNLYSLFLSLGSKIYNHFRWRTKDKTTIYPPKFVNLFLLFLAYMTERSRKASLGDDRLILEKKIYPESVDDTYKDLLWDFVKGFKDENIKECYWPNKLYKNLRIASCSK